MPEEMPVHPDPNAAQAGAPAAQAPLPPLADPDPVGGEAALLRWRPHAAALQATDVPTMAADGRLAMWNTNRGLEAIRPYVAALQEALPKLDWTVIDALGDLALATAYADLIVDRAEPAASDLPTLKSRVYVVREQLLKAAETLASFGLLHEPAVAAIREGRGLPDAAADASALAALFRQAWPTVAGKTPVSKELVEEAGTLGAQVLQILKPAAGKGKVADTALAKLRQERDGLWALLVAGHSEMSVAAYYQWREGYRGKVPALLARRG